MNRKAFTMVELLAVIVILGVVLMIAVPSYSSYINKTKNEVYKSYEEAMKDAAKTYVTECIYKNIDISSPVTLGSLIEKNYIEEISTKDCNPTDSKVEITYVEENYSYTYKVNLVCTGYTTP